MSKIVRLIIAALTLFILASCTSAPTNRSLSKTYLQNPPETDKASKVEENLTLGENQLSAGYSAEVTLITESLIKRREEEKGVQNMDSPERVKKTINEEIEFYTKKKTCFIFKVHTYSLDRAKFVNWVSKLKQHDGKIHDIAFTNISGVQSVPETFEDMNGRRWHNVSVGCTKKDAE